MENPFSLRAGMRYTFTYRPGPAEVPGKGWFPQEFARGAFDRSVGKVVPLTMNGRQLGHGRLMEADVADDGGSVQLTYEVTDLDAGQAAGDAPSAGRLEDSNGPWWYPLGQLAGARSESPDRAPLTGPARKRRPDP